MTRQLIILFDHDDHHSTSLARAFCQVCEPLLVTVVDPNGEVHNYDDARAALAKCSRMLPNLVNLVSNRLVGKDVPVNAPDHVEFEYHLDVFRALHANGVIEHPRNPFPHDVFPEARDEDYYAQRVAGEYTRAHADRLVALINGVTHTPLLEHLCALGTPDEDFCFAMPPCGFDRIPAYILDFSHKLVSGDDGLRYRGKEGLEGAARELGEPINVMRALVDIALCRVIYDQKFRYYGTCHGAQAMWLAVGERLTRLSRFDSSTEYEKEKAYTQTLSKGTSVSIDRGGLTTVPNASDEHGTLPVPQRSGADYSSDFNHQHFMVEPASTTAIAKRWVVRHPLTHLVPEEALAKTQDDRLKSRATRKLLRKKNAFVQAFCIDRMLCFQDHPHYHIDSRSASHSGRLATNTKYENSGKVLGQVWEL